MNLYGADSFLCGHTVLVLVDRDTKFFGPGAGFAVDSTQPMTVVTQFHTTDGTANGDLKEIKRFYVQNGMCVCCGCMDCNIHTTFVCTTTK